MTNKTPEQIAEERNDEKIKAAKKYAKQYEGLMYTIGSIAGVSGIQRAFERGVAFGLHQALEITVEREKAERAAEQHWISVKERLPEYDQFVLLWHPDFKRQFVGCRVDSGIIDPLYWWKLELDMHEPDRIITHWMPLPEPPKEEK